MTPTDMAPTLSVVSATFNRAALLDRALATLADQTLPTQRWEYLLADDGSDDNTREVVDHWQHQGVPVRYLDVATDLRLPKPAGQWRDGCKVRNAASTLARGRFLLMTHPEILVPPDGLASMLAAFEGVPEHDRIWVTAIPYWLPPMSDEEYIQPLSRGLALLRDVEGFYDPSWPDKQHSPGAPDYRNQHQETRTDWESEVFWCMRMGDWRWLGGFREFDAWGSVDMDFVARRRRGEIRTVVAPALRPTPLPASREKRSALAKAFGAAPQEQPNGAVMVYHQYHDSPRDMDKALAELQQNHADYSTVEAMRKAGGLYHVYASGPRERALPNREILADHLARYRWAAGFCRRNDIVLDVGSGTGYGSAILAAGGAVVTGIDADGESVDWANNHYPSATFIHADVMEVGLPFADGEVDQIVCFEAIEHVQDQVFLLHEFWRVLKPGGRWVLSTPQKGATSGTAWDRYMLTYAELAGLVEGHAWAGVDWFHLPSYGSRRVLPGVPPATAQVQIVGATKPSAQDMDPTYQPDAQDMDPTYQPAPQK